MARFFHPLLRVLASATHRDLAAQVQYLKAENEVLRSKLPKRVTVTDAEKARLVKLGTKVGSAIRELITIVSPRRFTRWIIGRAPCGGDLPAEPIGDIECRERLGGLLKHCYRRAA